MCRSKRAFSRRLDDDECFELLLVSQAAFRLGLLHEAGLGVAADPAAALVLFEEAAELDHKEAQEKVALLTAKQQSDTEDTPTLSSPLVPTAGPVSPLPSAPQEEPVPTTRVGPAAALPESPAAPIDPILASVAAGS